MDCKGAILFQHPQSPTATKESILHGNLKVRPLFLQRHSCPGLQAVSRNESIVKSNSTALMTGSPDWTPPWEYCSQLHLGLAAAGCAENDHTRFKNVRGCFSTHRARVCSQSARSQAHKPHSLHVCKFNHCCLMSCTNLIM